MVALPTELAQEIIQTARGHSAIMQLARRVTLPGGDVCEPTDSARELFDAVGEEQ